MRPTHSLACVLAALALLAGCERTAPGRTGAGMPPVPIAQPAEAQAPDSPEEVIALQRLVAHRDWNKNRSASDTVVHQLAGRYQLPEPGGQQRTLLIYASRGSQHDCSACAPALSFFEFVPGQAGQAPRLLLADLAAVSLGYAGEAPKTRVQALGGDRYLVLLTWEAFAQGSSSQLLMLTPVKGRMREVFSEAIGGSHTQVIDRETTIEVEWEADYRFQPGPGPYLDLHLRRRFIAGKHWLLDPVRGPFASERTAQGKVPTELVYRFDGQRMKLVMSR